MKFQSSTLLNKDVQNFTSFYTFSCGKLCGNCGKHSKIAIFVNFQTDVLVENYLQEITSLAFSMFLFFVKNHRIVQYFVDLIHTNKEAQKTLFFQLDKPNIIR